MTDQTPDNAHSIRQAVKSLQTKSGRFTISAFDQRGSIVKILKLNHEKSEDREHIKQVKKKMMQVFSPICSAVLVDHEFGLEALSEKHPDAGLLLSLEKSSYETVDQKDLPLFYDDWGIPQIVQNGGSVKFLLFYHPESQMTDKKSAIVRSIHDQSHEQGVAFVFEPLLHMIPGKDTTFDHYLRMVEGFASRCDVLKIEYPRIDGESLSKDEARARCKEITQTVGDTPWILLSRGVEFAMFKDQLEIALEAGASGFAAGRAVWQEVGESSDLNSQREFLETVAFKRMQELTQMVE